MTREERIAGLEKIAGFFEARANMAVGDAKMLLLNWVRCAETTARELKAQEPVEPTIGGDADGPCGNWWYQCGKCKEAIDYHDRYCRNCGQAVKWNG